MAAPMSWASKVKLDAEPVAELVAEGTKTCVVVDANAIIRGVRLERIADGAVTTPEVFEEIRDKQSRQALATLPFEIVTKEPSEEAIKEVMRFARATGDLHSLSAVDCKLLALHLALETEAHGTDHINKEPKKASVVKRSAPNNRALPGWGQVRNPADWAEVDNSNANEYGAAGASKISGLQSLSVGEDGEVVSHGAPGALAPPSYAAEVHAQQQRAQTRQRPAGQKRAVEPEILGRRSGRAEKKKGAAVVEGAVQGEDDQEDDGEWETAKSRTAKARQAKKAERRRLKEEEELALQEVAVADLGAILKEAEEEEKAAAAAAEAARGGGEGAGDDEEDDAEAAAFEAEVAAAVAAEESAARAAGRDEGEPAGGGEEELEGWGGEGDGDGGDGGWGDDGEEGSDGEGRDGNGFKSTICSCTGDFAMQNVLLQMGLRLVAPDGLRIRETNTYVLKCQACTQVTKEVTRVFCPRCGNQGTLKKVAMIVTENGIEYFDARSRFNIRGTRFSLAKPKGGRAGSNDAQLLREDQLLRYKSSKGGGAGSGDVFAPEFGPDAWFVKPNGTSTHAKGIAAMSKRNPNERKHSATNRRRK